MFNSWCDEENRNWISLFNSHAQIESDEIELSFSCCLRRRLYIVIISSTFFRLMFIYRRRSIAFLQIIKWYMLSKICQRQTISKPDSLVNNEQFRDMKI
ncbi:hypothetical protein T05_16137 [Trichinella murrelli]|uniref:Uncharacterized protein n=1 Tax=Trichinella murrelli TaxID=144512 RepID=A0A0V0U557_9BILA|nr:hypothetical protein T05_16137 [Trichinella murrelli]